MTFESYLQYFENILLSTSPAAPYDDAMYFDYTKLNWSRTSRWLKTGQLSEDILSITENINEPQQWIIITEPWCGDAAHIVPFLHKISLLNPLITVSYELRDAEPNRINDYLTNGGKAIPKLIVRNTEGKDLATWGPRPAKCQVIYSKLTAEKADFETIKTELQKWYNEDKGVEIQRELADLLKKI